MAGHKNGGRGGRVSTFNWYLTSIRVKRYVEGVGVGVGGGEGGGGWGGVCVQGSY